MGLLISSYVIRHDESFVLLISVPLETKHQGTKQRPRELIRFPGYWICRGSFWKWWPEHPWRAQTRSTWHTAVRKCQRRAPVVLAPPSGQIREKKFIFESGCTGVPGRPLAGDGPTMGLDIAFFSHNKQYQHTHKMIKISKKLILVQGSIFILVMHFKTVSSLKVKKKIISEWKIWTCIFNSVHHSQDTVESVVPNPSPFHLSYYILNHFRRNCWRWYNYCQLLLL